MAMLTVRNLSDDIHRALKARATQHGRSTEAEVREILAAAVMPATRLKMGDALAKLGKELCMTQAEGDAFEQMQDQQPAEPMTFE